MSGQQWGAVVGGIIGAFFGMPQLGAAIGGIIGGWIDPTQVNGPHIGDGAAQNSAEGQPIAWILGTAGWVQGNIIQISPRREVKKTDDGKGSGTEVNTFEAHQDFCILICESSEHRDSLMVGVLIVKVDGKIVYDMRPEKNFGAENAKFLRNHTFYDGNETQMPDPTMEAIVGVDNALAYRGVYTMVARDINLSQYGERIPTYEFVMVGAGAGSTEDVTSLVAPELSRFQDQAWPLADAPEFYEYTGFLGVTGGMTSVISHTADSPEEIIAYFSSYDYSAAGGGTRTPTNYLGYSASTSEVTIPNRGLDIDDYGVSNAITQPSVVDSTAVVLVYNDAIPTQVHNTLGYSGFCGIGSEDIAQDVRGTVARLLGATPGGQYSLMENCGDPDVYGTFALCIRVTRKVAPFVAQMGDPCLLGEPTLLPDADGFVQDCAGNVAPLPTYEEVIGVFLRLQNYQTSTASGRELYTQYDQGPVMLETDPNNTEAYWEAAYDASVAAGTSVPGLLYPGSYPVTVTTAYQATYASSVIESDTISVATAITRIAERGGLTAADIDVTEMDQELLGYPIMQSYNAADCIRPLMTAFTSYGSEYDAKLRFHQHGEAIEIVVDPDDFTEGSETDRDTREQAIEYPRLISVTAIDPTQDYIARPQTERRITPDVRAIGEEQMQVPIVMTPDSQRQLAAIAMKVSWARAQGSREFSLPYVQGDEYLHLVAGKPFALDGKRYIASEYGLEDGEIKLKAVYDRQSAYTSDVTATPALPPTPPPSSIGGVTLFAALNLPVLRDQDDVVGLYFAVGGLLPSWPGCTLQVSADDQASWETAIASMTQSSTLGYLTAPLPLASASGDDITNTLAVAAHGGQLDSITRLQFLNEGNPCAIVKPGDTGECEVVSFQTASEVDPGDYELTILSRGGLATEPAAHAAGARFVSLGDVYFWQVPTAWIGRTLWFRPVTFGTPPDSNAAYSITFNPAVSQTEWPTTYLRGRYTGSAFIATVTPRHRLGNDLMPVASANFIGFRWTATDGVNSISVDTAGDSNVFDFSGWGTPKTITVAALNRITGPGPTESLII